VFVTVALVSLPYNGKDTVSYRFTTDSMHKRGDLHFLGHPRIMSRCFIDDESPTADTEDRAGPAGSRSTSTAHAVTAGPSTFERTAVCPAPPGVATN
jgi:hypothetical protein